MTKIKEVYKNNKILKIVITLCFLFILSFLILPIRNDAIISTTQTITPAPIIENGKKYSQTFKCLVNDLDSIGVRFSTYSIVNTRGKLHIRIEDSKKNTIYNEEVSLTDLKDNEMHNMNFKKISNSKNKKYKIEFEYSEYYEENSLTYWVEESNIDQMLIDNKNSGYTLNLNMYGKSKEYSIIWYPIIISSICYAGLVLADGGIKNEKKKK